jgi:hypothetical protein
MYHEVLGVNYEVKKECFVVETISPRNRFYRLLDVYEKL